MENINVKSTIRKSVNVDQRKIKKIRLLVTFLCSKADFYLIWVFGRIQQRYHLAPLDCHFPFKSAFKFLVNSEKYNPL